jgi:hypothetical protein
MTRQNFLATAEFETSSSLVFFSNRDVTISRNDLRGSHGLGQVVHLPHRIDASSSSSSSDSAPPLLGEGSGHLDGVREDPLCLVFDGAAVRGNIKRTNRDRGEESDDDASTTFTSVSQRFRLPPQSTVVLEPTPKDDDRLDDVKDLDPTLQKLYLSQQRTPRNDRTLPPPTQTWFHQKRLAAAERVEALIEERMKRPSDGAVQLLPLSAKNDVTSSLAATRPTATVQRVSPHDVENSAARMNAFTPCTKLHTSAVDVGTGIAQAGRTQLTSRTVNAVRAENPSTSTPTTAGMSLRDRWKMTSAHYRRVTETFSPTRHTRSASSSPQHRASVPPLFHQQSPPTLSVIGGIYEGYVSPFEALMRNGSDDL